MAVVLIALVASIPLFCSYLVAGHDLVFHLYRIEGIADALVKGDFPVRLQYVQAEGLGYPVSICYGDLFLYLPAFLRLLGLSTAHAYALFAIMVNAATAAVAYLCFRRIFRTRALAVTGCALWVLSPYRLVDLYVRCAVGEYVAMTFLPLIVLGMYLVFTHKPAKVAEGCEGFEGKPAPDSGRFGWIWCSVGLACVVYSHVITAVFAAVFCVIAFIVGLIFRRDRWIFLQAAKAVGCLVLLTAAFVLPFFDFMATNELNGASQTLANKLALIEAAALQPAQLLLLDPPMTGGGKEIAQGIVADMPMNIGWPVLAGVVLWVGLLISGLANTKNRFRFAVSIMLVAASAVLLLFATNIISWLAFPTTGPLALIGDSLSSIQYSYRLLGPVTLMLVFLTCLSLEDVRAADVGIAGVSGIKLSNGIAAALTVFAVIMGGVFVTSVMTEEADDMIFSFTGEEDRWPAQNKGLINAEYAPEGVADQEMLGIVGFGGLEDYAVEEEDTKLIVNVQVGDESGAVSLGRFPYAQYRVEPNAGFTGSCQLEERNLTLMVRFAPHSSGSVTVWFDIPVLWNVALGITYATVLALGAYGVWVASRKRKDRAAAGNAEGKGSAPERG